MLRLCTNVAVLKSNIAAVRKTIHGRLIFMVKADAYNHGMEIAPMVEKLVDGFGVSCVHEGAELRKKGVTGEIKTPVFLPSDLIVANDYSLLPVISDYSLIKQWNGKFDVKINVGMNRFGFTPSEIECYFRMNDSLRERITTVQAHLSCVSDEENAYQTMVATACAGNIGRALSLGGGAAIRYACDEYRIGLMIYGYGMGVRPALTVKTYVSAVQTVKKGEKIGYGGLYTMPHCGKIAVLQAGYYDGLCRKYVGNTVKINGNRYETVGCVCMDCCFAYVGDGDVKVGDTAVILDEEYDAVRIAERIGTIPYEVLTSYKGRIERCVNDEKRTEETAESSIGESSRKE